jgi:hypothetical protein
MAFTAGAGARRAKGDAMTRTTKMIRTALLAGGLLCARTAGAELVGSFDGTINPVKLGTPVSVAAVLSQAGRAVSGTVALPGDPSALGGAYLVAGTATPKRLTLKGFAGPVTFKWRAKIAGDTLTGKVRVKRPGQKLVGTLAMTRNVCAGDGSGCDGVFQAKQAHFEDQVLGQALVSCGTCHAPGLQAAATRLHVVAADPLATARSVALMVDPANPDGSRILTKPLALLPHGGGPQITAGGTQEQIITQWVDLLVQAQCN